MSNLFSSFRQLLGVQTADLEREGGSNGGLVTGGGEGVVVSEVIIYPVKSCGGISLPSANLQSTGLEWDRQWQVVNEAGRFVTQRQIPKMALIEVSLPVEALDRRWGPLQPESALSLNAPGMEPLRIPLRSSRSKPKIPASTWEWSGLAFDEGDEAAEWFSKYLGKPHMRLVRFDTVGETRPTDPDYAEGYETAFSDGYPILLISKRSQTDGKFSEMSSFKAIQMFPRFGNHLPFGEEHGLDRTDCLCQATSAGAMLISCVGNLDQASLDALNDQLHESLPMNRFRPNIVVEGCGPFAEDLWRNFKIGASPAEFQGVKLCSRCKVTTTNQRTAEVGREPLISLGHFRRGKMLSTVPNMKNEVYFGQNVVYNVRRGSESTVNVGDKVQILRNASSVNEVMTKAVVAV